MERHLKTENIMDYLKRYWRLHPAALEPDILHQGI